MALTFGRGLVLSGAASPSPGSAEDGSGESLAFSSIGRASDEGAKPCSCLSAACASTENSSEAEFEDSCKGKMVGEALSSAEDNSLSFVRRAMQQGPRKMEYPRQSIRQSSVQPR